MRRSPRTALRRRRQPSSQPRWASPRHEAHLGTGEQIKQAHLLLAMFNALQPGVFALSGWDLCGMLTLDRRQVGGLLADGDTRWIHRAAYDLMDYRPHANESLSKMPRGISLYGSLPRPVGGQLVVCPPARQDSGGSQALRDREQCPARCAAGVQQGHAGHGAPAQRRGAGHGA